MVKILKEKAPIKVGDKWLELKAILVHRQGGRAVAYVDKNGTERYSEPLCRSQFKHTSEEEKS